MCFKKKKSKPVQYEVKPETLGELALSGKSFYRFSQSKPGLSIESNLFAEYLPGQVTKAKDAEKLLSFVAEDTISLCYLYGDMLTKLNFNLDDERFLEIADTCYNYIGLAFCEYESQQLLVEENYSLSNLMTILKIIDTIKDDSQLISTLYHPCGKLEDRLHLYGFEESAAMVRHLSDYYKSKKPFNLDEFKQEARKYTAEHI